MKKSLKLALHNQCPSTIDIALKWCKAKTNWVEQAYDNFINILVDKKDRLDALHAIIKSDFHNTIAWHALDEDDKGYWVSIEAWVLWFTKNFQFVQSFLKANPDATALDVQNKWLSNYDKDYGKSLSEYVYNCAKQTI